MKKTLLTILLAVSAIGTAQITTSSSYTPAQLVNDVFLANSGITATNITSVSGITSGSVNSLGYFNQNGSSFSFQDGIILSTGNILSAPGPNTSLQSEGTLGTWDGDEAFGEGEMTSQNATILEFDFIAPSNHISFDYIYATEEYSYDPLAPGVYDCSNTDYFAIILTDETGNEVNLVVIPGTNTVVGNYNGINGSGCGTYLVNYYGNFYLSENATIAPINFNGATIPLTAQAQVSSGETYHIKIVVADRGDTVIDSALFIKGNSFHASNLDTNTPDAFKELLVFPNPTDNILNIESSSVISEITLFNMLGQKVQQVSPGTTASTMNISTLTSGTYILSVEREGNVETVKIVKQ